MNSFKKINALLTVNGKSIQFGSWDTYRIIGDYLEVPGGTEILSELAHSAYNEIRLKVSYYNGLSLEAIEFLLDDPVEKVVYETVTAQNGERLLLLNQQQILKLISRSPKIAHALARYVNKLMENTQIDRIEIVSAISRHPDPCVRHTLAENRSTPKELLEKLVTDSDMDVAQTAQNTLNTFQSEVTYEQL